MKKFGIILAFVVAILLPISSDAASFLNPNTRLVKKEGDSRLFLVSDGKHHHVRNLKILSSYPSRPVNIISEKEWNETENIALIKSPLGPRVYMVDEVTGQKVWFPTEASFVGSNKSWNDIVEVSGTDSRSYDDAILLKTDNDPKVYEINYSTLEKVHIKSEAEFLKAGFDWRKVVVVPSALLNSFKEVDSFSASPIVDNESDDLVEDKDEPVEPLGQLLVDQSFMPSILFASGTSHNVLQRLRFTAGTTTSEIDGITLKLKGFLNEQDFSSIAVVDDEGFLLAEPKLPSRTSVRFQFAEPFQIPANSTRIITVLATFNRDLTALGQPQVGFSLESEADIDTTNPLKGNFPIVGQLHKIAPGSTIIGDLSIRQDDSFALGNLVVGERDVVLNSFIFKELSGVEDITIHRVILTFTGSLRVSDFENLELVNESNRVIAHTPTVRDDQVAFILTSPYKIQKNEQDNLKIRGDVVGGSNRQGVVVIQNPYDVRVVGESNKFALTPTTIDGGFPVGRNEIIQLAPGSIAISLSKDSPVVGLPRGGEGVVLARFDVRPGTQNLLWKRVTLKLNSNSGAVPLSGNISIRPFKGDTVGSILASKLHNINQQINLDLPELQGNKVNVFEVVADISNSTRVGDSYQIVLSGAEFEVRGTGDDLEFNNEILTPNRSVQEVTLLVRGDSNYEPSEPVAGRTRYKIAQFLLTPSAGEDVVVKEIVLSPLSDNTQFSDGFSNLDLEGSKISAPTGQTYKFAFEKTLRTGKEVVFDLSIDTTKQVDGLQVGYKVDSVTAVGKISGALVDVNLSNTETETVTFKTTNLNVSAVSVPESDKLIDDKVVLGAFELKADSVEDIDISALTIVEADSSDGISITDGYSNLRIERASDRRSVTRTIASPVGGQGGDRLTNGPRLEAGQSQNYYIVANNDNPSGDRVRLSITNIEAKGRSSKLSPTIIDTPIILGQVNY